MTSPDTREPGWGGLPNLRDLGGIPLVDGGVTRFGRIFRSGYLDDLDAGGWEELLEGGVGTTVDLRNDYEVVSLPDRPNGILAHHRPVEDQSDAEFMTVWGEHLGSPRYYPEVLVRWPSMVAAAFQAIADAPLETAVIVHCAAGRDRTGMIAALLLQAAGVGLAAIQDDYELGMRAYRRHNDSQSSPRERILPDDEFEALVVRHRADLADFLAATEPSDVVARAAGRLR